MRTVLTSRKAAPALALLALWVASLACAGGGGETPAPVQTDAPALVTQASVGPSSRGAISSVDDVKSATIQIVAEGTLVMPGGTVPNANWSGSGFIIDPSGIAVTNNHVVTGAARMKVLVGGEDEPRNARVLGVAECSDLAVIDIDGDGFPFMAWREGSADVGLDVYAAGCPLGDPEYTLTRGIVSKARADGDRAGPPVPGGTPLAAARCVLPGPARGSYADRADRPHERRGPDRHARRGGSQPQGQRGAFRLVLIARGACKVRHQAGSDPQSKSGCGADSRV